MLDHRNIHPNDSNQSRRLLSTHIINHSHLDRFTYNKKKLVKNGFDPLKTEVEIMHEIGNYRVFGCGQDKWVWSK